MGTGPGAREAENRGARRRRGPRGFLRAQRFVRKAVPGARAPPGAAGVARPGAAEWRRRRCPRGTPALRPEHGGRGPWNELRSRVSRDTRWLWVTGTSTEPRPWLGASTSPWPPRPPRRTHRPERGALALMAPGGVTQWACEAVATCAHTGTRGSYGAVPGDVRSSSRRVPTVTRAPRPARDSHPRPARAALSPAAGTRATSSRGTAHASRLRPGSGRAGGAPRPPEVPRPARHDRPSHGILPVPICVHSRSGRAPADSSVASS